MKYSDLHKGTTIIHVVGGRMNADLAEHMGQIAQWFVDNDITLLWGDDYQAKYDKKHPVKVLADQIAMRGGNKPIRILQLGTEDYSHLADLGIDCEDVVDERNNCLGVVDKSIEDEVMIYTDRQQNRQMLYYNNADALMVLDGGIGAAYEIPNSIIYGFSGDVPPHFKTIVIDNPQSPRFRNSVDAYLHAGDLIMQDISQLCYFPSAWFFTRDIQNEIITKEDDDDEIE